MSRPQRWQVSFCPFMTRQTGPTSAMLSARGGGVGPAAVGEPPDRERGGGDDRERRADQKRRPRPEDLPPDAEEDGRGQRRESHARVEGAERPPSRARTDEIGNE